MSGCQSDSIARKQTGLEEVPICYFLAAAVDAGAPPRNWM